MIKVLYVISNLNQQGPINQLFYLCKYINKKKVEPYILTTSQTSFETSLHSNFKELGINIIDLKLNKVNSILYAHKKIQTILDKNDIDIIQSFGFRSDIISGRLKRVYKITTVRNTLLYNYKMIWGPILGSLFGNVNLYYIKKFDSIIACSHSVHNYLKTLNLHSDVIVNSIDTENISHKLLNNDINRRLLKLPLNEIICITVSSKLKGKNIEFLIDSFLRNELVENNLLVAGYVEQATLNKYKSVKNIFFLGKVNNLMEYIKASDFFISASLHEGMPNAVLEAMAVGTPVMLSDIPSHIEIINSTTKEIGKIFKNDNYKDFLKTFNEIVNSDYTLLSKNCLETVHNKFNAINMAMEYEKYYVKKNE